MSNLNDKLGNKWLDDADDAAGDVTETEVLHDNDDPDEEDSETTWNGLDENERTGYEHNIIKDW